MADTISNNDESNGFWNTLRELLLQRFTSPLISTFVISWCVTNYKVLLIVFGKGEIPDKLKLLDSYFLGTTISFPAAVWIYGIPAFMTLFYIFVYPHINLWVMEYVNENDNKLKTQQELNKYKKVVDQLKHDAITITTKLNEATEEVSRLEAAAREEFDRNEENLRSHQRSHERLEAEKTGIEAELMNAQSALEDASNKIKELTYAINNGNTVNFEDEEVQHAENMILKTLWPVGNLAHGMDAEVLRMSVMRESNVKTDLYRVAFTKLIERQFIKATYESSQTLVQITTKAANDPLLINIMPRPRRL